MQKTNETGWQQSDRRVDIAPDRGEVNQIRIVLNQLSGRRGGDSGQAASADQSSSVSRTTTSTRATRAPDGGSGRPTTVSAPPGMSCSRPLVS